MKKKIAALLCALAVVTQVPVYSAMASAEKPAAASNASSEMNTEIPKGEPVDENEASEIIKKVNEKMSEVKNVEIEGTSKIKAQGQESVMDTKGVYDFEDGAAKMQMTMSGQNVDTFVKDGKSYVMSPESGEWTYTELAEGNGVKDSVILSEEAQKFMTVEKLSDGYVIRTKKPLNKEELEKVNADGNFSDALGSDAQNMKITADIAVVVDNDMKYKNFYMDMKIGATESNDEMTIRMHTSYRNYDKAEKIETPEGIDAAQPAVQQ